MSLKTYRSRRNFTTSAEPAGEAPSRRRRRAGLAFVVQKHDASRLHYDLRLEMDGVLRSWAVPKGPSMDPADRVLAVQVEDHPLEYGSFEGTIPQGQYGGGTVMLWDRGTWAPVDTPDPARSWRKGSLTFTLHGRKLRGRWRLVRMKSASDDTRQNWLLIKEDDRFSRRGRAGDPRVTRPNSVLTRRTLQQIAGAKPAAAGTRSRGASGSTPRQASKRQATVAAQRRRSSSSRASSSRAPSSRPRSPRARGSRARPSRSARPGRTSAKRSAPSDLPGAVRRPIPSHAPPQLCRLVAAPPAGDEWVHEAKFDGYRMLTYVRHADVRLLTRHALDWTRRFPETHIAVRERKWPDVILDGEIVCLDANGVSDFQGLQSAFKAGRTGGLVYFVFDVLYMNGLDLRGCSLRDRRRVLNLLLATDATAPPSAAIRLSEQIDGHGDAVLRSACRLGLEGVICKRLDSVYTGARTGDWLKVKCTSRQELVIGGYTDAHRSRRGFGALLVGYYDAGGTLAYAGKVGSGYDRADLTGLIRRLKRLARSTPAFASIPAEVDTAACHWVRPQLVAEVEFSQWTRDGRLRHPVFTGIREDKEASEVVREQPAVAKRAARRAARPAGRRSSTPLDAPECAADPSVLGVRMTHASRVVYPDAQITKFHVAEYYAAVAERVLPGVQDRPLSLLRCPRGATGPCFFNKHMDIGSLPGLKQVRIRESTGVHGYVTVTEATGLISLVQMNTLELHGWGSRADRLEHPDMLVLDLDPGPGLRWPDVVQAARTARALLERVGLLSFVKTSGGKGLHVVAPIRRRSTWDDAKALARAVAERMTALDPARYIDTASKSRRRGRIFVDYLRNQRGATAIAPYSTRARPGATVSMPVPWERLDRLTPAQFTIATVPSLLSRRTADPWATFGTLRQSLTRAAAAAISTATP